MARSLELLQSPRPLQEKTVEMSTQITTHGLKKTDKKAKKQLGLPLTSSKVRDGRYRERNRDSSVLKERERERERLLKKKKKQEGERVLLASQPQESSLKVCLWTVRGGERLFTTSWEREYRSVW